MFRWHGKINVVRRKSAPHRDRGRAWQAAQCSPLAVSGKLLISVRQVSSDSRCSGDQCQKIPIRQRNGLARIYDLCHWDTTVEVGSCLRCDARLRGGQRRLALPARLRTSSSVLAEILSWKNQRHGVTRMMADPKQRAIVAIGDHFIARLRLDLPGPERRRPAAGGNRGAEESCHGGGDGARLGAGQRDGDRYR